MQIKEIYKGLLLPPNLQEHMFRVAQVVSTLKDHWQSTQQPDWNFLIRAALLHDVGNIVKFDLDNHPEFLGEEVVHIEYWRKVKEETVAKYGSDDHEATRKMLREIGVEERIISLVQEKSFSNAVEVAAGEDLNAKILLYADLRVMPHGIVTLEDRINDIKTRMPQYTKREDFPALIEATRNIEKYIAGNLNRSLAEIDWAREGWSTEALCAIEVTWPLNS